MGMREQQEPVVLATELLVRPAKAKAAVTADELSQQDPPAEQGEAAMERHEVRPQQKGKAVGAP
jgi:hypothetical protein